MKKTWLFIIMFGMILINVMLPSLALGTTKNIAEESTYRTYAQTVLSRYLMYYCNPK